MVYKMSNGLPLTVHARAVDFRISQPAHAVIIQASLLIISPRSHPINNQWILDAKLYSCILIMPTLTFIIISSLLKQCIQLIEISGPKIPVQSS